MIDPDIFVWLSLFTNPIALFYASKMTAMAKKAPELRDQAVYKQINRRFGLAMTVNFFVMGLAVFGYYFQ